jgi:hypothetical protein
MKENDAEKRKSEGMTMSLETSNKMTQRRWKGRHDIYIYIYHADTIEHKIPVQVVIFYWKKMC